MSFTGEENHEISLSGAAALTAAYRSANPTGVQGHYFGRQAIEDILDQSGCVGIRIYYALDTSNNQHLVLVGVNSSEQDLYNGVLAERSVPCPPYCSQGNPLNEDTA